MIVGAGGDRDAEILATSSKLYRAHALRRVYYSAYSPIPGSDPSLPPAAPPLVREHRLYQADWLMRFYGYDAAELTTAAAPDLDLETDPKLAWALRHPGYFPVDVNRDPRERLLRIPGVGRRTVTRLLALRRNHRVTRADLRTLGVPLKKAAPFVVTADPASAARALDRVDLAARVRAPRQLSLFDAAVTAAHRRTVMTVDIDHDFEAWRDIARRLLAAGVQPADVTWASADRGQDVLPLDDVPADLPETPADRDRVPARFRRAQRGRWCCIATTPSGRCSTGCCGASPTRIATCSTSPSMPTSGASR